MKRSTATVMALSCVLSLGLGACAGDNSSEGKYTGSMQDIIVGEDAAPEGFMLNSARQSDEEKEALKKQNDAVKDIMVTTPSECEEVVDYIDDFSSLVDEDEGENLATACYTKTAADGANPRAPRYMVLVTNEADSDTTNGFRDLLKKCPELESKVESSGQKVVTKVQYQVLDDTIEGADDSIIVKPTFETEMNGQSTESTGFLMMGDVAGVHFASHVRAIDDLDSAKALVEKQVEKIKDAV